MVATLRADFYDRPLGYQDFGELIRTGTEAITPMSPDELELAIARPAELAGMVLEPGLAATVVADVAAEPGALPLMQYVMTELFERRTGTALTAAAYQELGAVAGALGRRAEELFGVVEQDGAEAARQVFLRLVAFGEGGEPTRRRALRSELRQIGRGSDVDRVLEVFGEHRLLLFDRDPLSRSPTVEVAHEALLHEWPRLRDSIEENRSDVLYQRRLALAVAEWQRAGEGPDHLLTGARVTEAEAWQQSTQLALSDLEQRYIAESVSHVAQARRARRRRRWIVGTGLATAAAVAVGFLVFALTQRSAANRLEGVEAVNRLIGVAHDELAVDPELSLLLAARAAADTESLGLEIFPGNLEVLHQALRNQRLLFTVDETTDGVFSPDMKTVYVGMADGSVSIRDATTGDEVDAIPASRMAARAAAPLALSEDGRWLTNGYVVVDTASKDVVPLRSPGPHLPVSDVDIAGGQVATAHFERGADGRGEPGRVVAVRDRGTGEELWKRHVEAPIYVDLSADARLLAVTSSPIGGPYSSVVFDVATGEATEIPLPVETLAVSFEPTGERLLLGVGEVIRHWVVDSRSFDGRRDGGHDAPVSDLDVSDDGSLIASGDQAGGVIVQDAERGEALYPLPRHAGVVTRIELSADGSLLATRTQAGFDDTGVLRVFDTSVAGGRDLLTIETGLPMLATVDSDPTGALLAVGDHSGSRQLWTSSGELRRKLAPHAPFEDPVGISGPIALSPDGTRLVTGDASGAIRVWDAAGGDQLASTTVARIAPDLGDETLGRLAVDRDVVFSVAFSPDGRLIAVAGAGFVLVADAATLRNARVLHESPLTFTERVAFSPDGTHLIAGAQLGVPPPEGFTNPVIVWDVATGEEVSRFPGGTPGSAAVDYSPAGDLVAIGASNVTILDTATWDVSRTLQSTSEDVWDVAFSPDGKVFAAAYADGAIQIWDPHDGLPLYSLPGHDGPAADLDWTADGTRLISVGLDGAIRGFAIDPAELVDLARARVTRALTDQECRQYVGGEGC